MCGEEIGITHAFYKPPNILFFPVPENIPKTVPTNREKNRTNKARMIIIFMNKYLDPVKKGVDD